MKVVLVTEVYKPTQNSVTHSIELTRNELVALGHDVRIITPSPHGVQLRDKRVYHVPGIPFPGGSGYQMTFPQLSQADQYLQNADIIHAHQPFTLGSWAQKIANRKNIPFIFTSHLGSLSYNHFVPVAGGIIKKSVTSYLAGFLAKCDLVIAPTGNSQKELKKQKASTPVICIPSGIESARFSAGDGANLRKKLAIGPTDQVLIYAGAITQEKSIKSLIRAVAEIKEKPKLIVAGSGSELEAVRKLVNDLNIEDHIFLLGQYSYKDMPQVYAAGDIFVSCSLVGSDSLALIEAQATGLPAVVVNTPNTKDIIVNGLNGFITKNTKVAFNTAIRKILNRPQLLAHLRRGAKKSSKKYSIEGTTKQLIDAYRLAITLKKDQA